jgi:hypothetical protein
MHTSKDSKQGLRSIGLRRLRYDDARMTWLGSWEPGVRDLLRIGRLWTSVSGVVIGCFLFPQTDRGSVTPQEILGGALADSLEIFFSVCAQHR